jgi:hypothetical protein
MTLTPKQKRFVDEYLVDLNATQAAIRAGYSERNAGKIGPELLGKTGVSVAIAAAMKARATRTEITQDMVLQRLWSIATADANDLVQYRRNCCRHCWGIDHFYQWTEAEFETAKIEAAKKNNAEPTCEGGFGFDRLKAANPECPECKGEGKGSMHVQDTRNLKGGARLMYAGVKLGKDGLEVKMHDQMAALEKVARHLGMFKDRTEISGPNGGPIQTESRKLQDMTDDELLAIATGRGEGTSDPA